MATNTLTIFTGNQVQRTPSLASAASTAPQPEVHAKLTAEARAHIPCIELGTAEDERLSLLRESSGPRAHAYRLLRHRLATLGDPRVVVITSATEKQGKTACALNLALALGEEGSRVLLLEANIVRPVFQQIFDVSDSGDDLAASNWSAIHLASAGIDIAFRDPASNARIKRHEVLTLMARLRAWYAYVVIDTPSIHESADVNLLAAGADGVVLAARAKQARRKQLRRAVDQLGREKLLGIVLTDAPNSEVSCV